MDIDSLQEIMIVINGQEVHCVFCNCAQHQTGAWWYIGCTYSNLNGHYFNTATDNGQGIFWHIWKNAYTSLKFTEMKTRRNN